MNIKKMLFEVEIHRVQGWDKYRILANDDLEAREKAIELDNDTSNESDLGKIVYCEIILISEIDAA